jgi:hypothetical protein
VQGIATALVTLGGLVLSLSCAVLLEELFLGGLFRLFFAPRPGAGAPNNRRFCGWWGGQKRSSGRMK